MMAWSDPDFESRILNFTIFTGVMKKLFFIATIALLFSGCNNDNSSQGVETDAITNSASAEGEVRTDLPEIKFEEDVFDFGRISQGEKVTHAFKFKNVGKSNLIISGASGSC